MKKVFILLTIILIAGGLLTGCSRNTVTIGRMSKDFTNLELTDHSLGTTITLDESSSEEFYEEIKNMKFTKTSSEEDNGMAITVKFLKASKELDQFVILGENIIEYQGDVYQSDESFDLQEVELFLAQQFTAVVIQAGKGLLVTPMEGTAASESSDRISVGVNETEILDDKGNTVTADLFKPGDKLRIFYNGVILESYPAQVAADRIEYLGRELQLDGYMAVIDDIYQEDSGLNGDIMMIAFDTTEWLNLTEIEKEILLSMVKEKYGFDTLQGTFEELSEQGLIDKNNLYFPEGILIEIKNVEWNEKDKALKCSISKWRSGLGAIGADVKATYDGGSWNLSKTGMWIS